MIFAEVTLGIVARLVGGCSNWEKLVYGFSKSFP